VGLQKWEDKAVATHFGGPQAVLSLPCPVGTKVKVEEKAEIEKRKSFAHRKPASERDSCRAVRARGKTASNLDCYQFSKKAPTLRKNSSCRCEL